MQTTIATTSMTSAFDAASAKRGLTRTVATAIAVTAGALACICFLAARPDWWHGYAAATVASCLAAGLSLIPLHNGLSKGFAAIVPAVMAATFVRTAVSLGGCLLAITLGHYPAVPTLLLMMPYYLTLLGVESLFLVKLGKTK